jgi:hypothetical protein
VAWATNRAISVTKNVIGARAVAAAGFTDLEPAAMPPFPGLWAAVGPGLVWLALAQGSGELIFWPYLVAIAQVALPVLAR